MSSPSWTTVRQEFTGIYSLPEAERAARLAAMEPALRAEVESLIAALDESPGFLPLSEPAPSVIGAYRLVEEIGRGGMGVVYRAERTDGEYRRQVALKLADGRLFGPDAERRFIRERQILAHLDHPNIVRMLDGGVSEGRRYFVMEFVEGVPVTAYVQSRPLPERLEIFLALCGAIQHAHRHLILHRDLKPGNILVTPDGSVKVLDFGIAQILRPHPIPSLATATSAHPLSFACASPEQLRGEPLSLSSDVYSLGLLLYEILTNVNPQHLEGDTFESTFRRVLDEAPPPPSSKVPRLSRDLDAIVLKALAKQTAERYGSVQELSADIRRYLAGLPVTAVPPSMGYRLHRFLRRNKLWASIAAAGVAALAVAAVVYVREQRLERRRFEDARKLAHAVIFDIQPRMEGMPGAAGVRKSLIEETTRYLESLSQDAGGNVDLLLEISNGYQVLARVLNDGTVSNLGDPKAAENAYRKSEELMGKVLSRAPERPGVLRDAVTLYSRLASYAGQRGEPARSRELASLALQYARRRAALEGAHSSARESLASALFEVGRSAGPNVGLAISSFEEAGRLYRALGPGKPLHLRNAALTDRYLVGLLADRKEFARAAQHARAALEISEKQLAQNPDHQERKIEVSVDLAQLARVMDGQEAVALYARAVRMREEVLAADPKGVRAKERLATVKINYAVRLLAAGEVVESRRQIERSVELFDSLRKAGQLPVSAETTWASALSQLGHVEDRASNPTRACAAFRRSAALYEGTGKRQPLWGGEKENADKVAARLRQCM